MSKEIPDPETISKASDILVYGAKGEEVKFGSLFDQNKTIVVFIRHFFCGAYVSHVSQVPQSALDEAGTKIVVIGCGEWAGIQAYADTAKFSGQIYADPSRKLYHSLGMTIETLATTPSGQQKRSYLTSSFFSNVIQSIWRGPLQHPNLIGKQGNISQLGGEFIFGPGNSCSFASRMQHTEDHVEVADLMAVAGVKYP
ncbi:AhpC/TSA antioxidant enzyme domain containing protein [Amanita muscaria]